MREMCFQLVFETRARFGTVFIFYIHWSSQTPTREEADVVVLVRASCRARDNGNPDRVHNGSGGE